MSYPPHPRQQPPPWQPPQRPAGVPVLVDTSGPIITRYGFYPMMVEFAAGMRIRLVPRNRHQFFLPPGVYQARFYSFYFGLRVGKAETVIDTRPGHPVFVGYAAPYTIWSRGAAGYPPVPRPGIAAIVVIIAIALAVPLLIVLITLLTER